ncbi:MAG: MarR family winged helix-turn-helix transcriptional regulator [Anaerolineae bacterium]
MSANEQLSIVLREWAKVFLRRSMREFWQFMQQTHLSSTQISTLMRLYHHSACGVSDVGDHLGITSAAASQMVQRLVEQGLVERTEDPHDRRVKQLTLTTEGRALVDGAIEARRRWLADLTASLNPDEQQTIITALTTLTGAARTLEGDDSHF